MVDIIVVAVLLAIVAISAGYIIKAKKNGQKCIGCPDGCCSKSSCCECSCGCSEEN